MTGEQAKEYGLIDHVITSRTEVETTDTDNKKDE